MASRVFETPLIKWGKPLLDSEKYKTERICFVNHIILKGVSFFVDFNMLYNTELKWCLQQCEKWKGEKYPPWMWPDSDFAFMFILYGKKEMHTFLFLWESTFLGGVKHHRRVAKQHRRVANV